MQVYTFSQNLCSDNCIIVVLPLSLIIGIEISTNGLLFLIAVGSRDFQHTLTGIFQRIGYLINRCDGFREDYEFLRTVVLFIK